jgi:hypothetical protein
MNNLSQAVQALVEVGHMCIPVDGTLIEEAKAALRTVHDYCQGFRSDLSVTRRGEDGFDLGYIIRDGSEAADVKEFFHFAHDLCTYTDLNQKSWLHGLREELRLLGKVYTYLNELSLDIAQVLDDEHGHLFREKLLTQMKQSTRESRPYEVPALRSLWYKSHAKQLGASTHIDRNFLTTHFGDEGGKLIGRMGGEPGRPFECTPDKGFAVVFFGVKALYATNGKLQPFWHESEMVAGLDRRALVHFAHVDIGFPVVSARRAYEDFYRAVLR